MEPATGITLADITGAFTDQSAYVLGLSAAVIGAIVFRHSLSSGYAWLSTVVRKAAKPVKTG